MMRSIASASFQDDSKQYVRETPTKAVFTALGVGFVLALIFNGNLSVCTSVLFAAQIPQHFCERLLMRSHESWSAKTRRLMTHCSNRSVAQIAKFRKGQKGYDIGLTHECRDWYPEFVNECKRKGVSPAPTEYAAKRRLKILGRHSEKKKKPLRAV